MRRFCYSCFGATRIPKLDSDEIVNVAHPHPSRHVVVLVRDQVFRLELFDRHDQLRNVDDLEASLRGIVEEVKQGDVDLSVGVLTGSDRDHWAVVGAAFSEPYLIRH
jgi:carnitine O-acetyltransferase